MLQLLSKSLIVVGVAVICFYGDGVKMGMIVSFIISKFSGSKILSHKNIHHEYLFSHVHDIFGFWAGWLPFFPHFQVLVRIVLCCVIGAVGTT